MLLFLIFVGLLVIAIIGLMIAPHLDETFLPVIAIVSTILVFMILIILIVQVPAKIDSQRLEVDKHIVEIQLRRINEGESQDYLLKGDFGSLEDVYRLGRKINKQILSSRYWRENIWFNWFNNPYYGDIELIDFSIEK